MRARGILAVVVFALAPGVGRAGDSAACVIDPPAITSVESVRATLRLRNGDAPGFWISEPAMKRAAIRITTCIDLASKCQVDLATQNAKVSSPGWKAWAIGITASIVIAGATGFAYGRLK